MKTLIKNVLIPKISDTDFYDILISDKKIEKIEKYITDTADTIIDGEEKLVCMYGLFDMHVHFRDPGLTYKEDIITGGTAAKAGGFTAVACMPNTIPTIDTKETIEYVLNKAKETKIDVYPIACVTKGMLSKELCDYDTLIKAGAVAFSDDGRPVENAELMRRALEINKQNKKTIISHCEDLNIINGGIINKGEISKRLNVKGMDRASEDSITAREIAIAMSCDGHIHIAHVSTKGSVNIIRAAKKDGVNVTCETAPHYFTYTDEKLLKKDADYRMSPPLREEADRKAIEEAIIDGTIDCIITDHAPHSEDDKKDFYKAPNGVVGLETSLAVTLTQLYHTNKLSLKRIEELMSINPRKVLGLNYDGTTVGNIADLTLIDTDYEWTVEKDNLHSKSKNTVFKGEKLKGKAMYTISKGEVVYKF